MSKLSVPQKKKLQLISSTGKIIAMVAFLAATTVFNTQRQRVSFNEIFSQKVLETQASLVELSIDELKSKLSFKSFSEIVIEQGVSEITLNRRMEYQIKTLLTDQNLSDKKA